MVGQTKMRPVSPKMENGLCAGKVLRRPPEDNHLRKFCHHLAVSVLANPYRLARLQRVS
jgi:hypothetical protein